MWHAVCARSDLSNLAWWKECNNIVQNLALPTVLHQVDYILTHIQYDHQYNTCITKNMLTEDNMNNYADVIKSNVSVFSKVDF